MKKQEELTAFWKAENRLYNETNQLYHRLARHSGLPFHLLDLDAAHSPVVDQEAARGEAPTTTAALLMTARRLQYSGPLGPRRSGVLPYGWLRHDFDLLHAAGTLPNAGPDTVGTRVAAPDDQHPATSCRHTVCRVYEIAVEQGVLLRQLLESKVNTCRLTAGQGEVARRGRTGAEHPSVKLFRELLRTDLNAHFEVHSLGLEQTDAAVDNGLVELEVRNAVAQQATGTSLTVEHRDRMAQRVEPTGDGKSRRSRTDDSHTTPRASRIARYSA